MERIPPPAVQRQWFEGRAPIRGFGPRVFGWQVRGLYARLVPPDVNPQLPKAHAARGGCERGEELRAL